MFWQRCLKKLTPLTGGEEEYKSKFKKKLEEDEEEDEEPEQEHGQEQEQEEGGGEDEGEELGTVAEGEVEEGEGSESLELGESFIAEVAAPPVQKREKKLLNAFNFCERAAMTYNNPYRVRRYKS